MGIMEIDLHPNTMNKKGGFSLHKAWKPPIYSLKESRQGLLYLQQELPISLLQ
jgi:hypothetical protein